MDSLKNLNLINLLVVSVIPLLILGPFLPDLIVSISTLCFLYYIIKKKKFNYLLNKVTIIFFFFCTTAIISSLFSEKTIFSLKSSLFYFRIGIFSILIWYLIDRDKKILNYFYYTLIFCFLGLVVDGFYQFYYGENILGLKLIGTRISSFFGDELVMGSYLSRLFPLLFAIFLVKEKQKFEIYFVALLFILIDVLIYMSGERTAFFFLNLSTIFIILLIKEYQKFRLITFILAIFTIIILSMNSPKLTERMFLIPAKDMGFIKNSKKPAIFSEIHDSHIRTAINLFKDKPILGHGPKMFRIKCSEKKYAVGRFPCSSHPHNFYVQLLAETGIVGFSFLLIAFCYVIFQSINQLKTILFKQKRHITDYQVCLLAAILITVWPFSPSGNFFTNWMIIMYSLPVGFYLQSIYSNKKLLK